MCVACVTGGGDIVAVHVLVLHVSSPLLLNVVCVFGCGVCVWMWGVCLDVVCVFTHKHPPPPLHRQV